MGKRGQLTIFIIIGIILVAIISLFLLSRAGVIPKIGGGSREESSESFLETCLEDKVIKGMKIISLQGGYINNPLNKTFRFKDESFPTYVSYLCYTQSDYFPCVNQEPVLFPHLENEIKDYISEDVESCFYSLKSNLEKQGYKVDPRYNGFEVKLNPKKVAIDIDAEMTLTKADETSKQEDFEVGVRSSLYEIVIMVQKIINKEAMNCEFNQYDSFLNPEFDINKYRAMDSSIIYIVRHEESNEEFRFAVRGCIIPPGY